MGSSDPEEAPSREGVPGVRGEATHVPGATAAARARKSRTIARSGGGAATSSDAGRTRKRFLLPASGAVILIVVAVVVVLVVNSSGPSTPGPSAAGPRWRGRWTYSASLHLRQLFGRLAVGRVGRTVIKVCDLLEVFSGLPERAKRSKARL